MTFTLQIEDSTVDNFMWVLDHFKDVVKVTPKNENDEDKVDYALLKQTRNESAISLECYISNAN